MSDTIKLWKSWWQGCDNTFHRFYENGANGDLIRRDMYRMNMAKKVCEDWASLIFNDEVSINIEDESGEKFVRTVFEENDFFGEANKLTETAFALGTAAAILRFENLELDENGDITAGEHTHLTFDYVDAEHIHPISVRGGRITEAAFISESTIHGEDCIYVETHRLENGRYVITNEFYAEENGDMVKKPNPDPTIPEVIKTNSPYPLFFILKPNIANNHITPQGMGVSVFADAIDCLKGVDLAFNNFCRDIKLGGKKVFLSRSLIQRDDYGNILTPDDVAQQLFVTLGDGDITDTPLISEHDPELRCADNALAVQSQLNYLSFRCGLGTHHYTFDVDGRTKLTATQYMGERQDMRQNLVKHQRNARNFVISAARAVLWCAKELYHLDVHPDAKISMTFDDSYFSDSDTKRAADLTEVQAGVMTTEEFRKKWLGGIKNS